MEIIRQELLKVRPGFGEIRLRVDRQSLAKRRWRGIADDGCEFGFDLDEPLADGAAFFETEEHRYHIAQNAEPVLELRIADCGLRKIAEIAWRIGNLHFQIELDGEKIRVADDPAVRQLFERENLAFEAREAVFHPVSGGHAHEG